MSKRKKSTALIESDSDNGSDSEGDLDEVILFTLILKLQIKVENLQKYEWVIIFWLGVLNPKSRVFQPLKVEFE